MSIKPHMAEHLWIDSTTWGRKFWESGWFEPVNYNTPEPEMGNLVEYPPYRYMYPARSDAAMVLLVEHIEEQGYEAVVLFDLCGDDRAPGERWVIVTDWQSPCWARVDGAWS